ncbi:PRC-barrel domain-containing protein [Microbacterium sp. HD4P20]|uniref:PRC-barrel domain-containing protein n=1 Tax=Microbacterium sp. HD4P20 TaxID=2864874 RepID=UPI001C640C19|nr:PRC-barrel domain-containing protein [Microbacterium sp. HD4P20]MCP2635437.1 PRC-barrel domain-containing protein [Microbacterium sp. HD4P20]
MNTSNTGTLLKLSEIDETVANPQDDIRDRDVKDRNGEDLGKVKDLLVDQSEKRVRFLEVASGGFLGIGQDTSLIPVDAITAITDEEVRIDQTRDHVAGAPAYDPALVRERDDYVGYLDYYGYGPWWGAGYRYPGYPYYP